MTEFSPAWFLPGPHLQTIWGRIARPRRLVQLRRESLDTPDGDELLLDHLDGEGDLHFLLLHGLEGSSYSVYMQGTLSILARHGHSATALNFRSCAREPHRILKMIPNRRPRFYHSGETGDFDFVARTLAARLPRKRLFAFGASLGGNVLLKWLGEHPNEPLLEAAATLSVPYDLGAGADHLDNTAAGRFYVSRFLRTLKRKCERPEIASRIDVEAMRRSKTFREFDDAATAPLHGFSGANDYYTRSSSIHWVGRITTPTLAMNAEDDPFVPPNVLPLVKERASPAVDFRTTPEGGHVGFIGGAFPWSAEYWAEELVVQWLLEEGGIALNVEKRRELLLSGAFAVWGLAIAISLLGVWRTPAPSDQTMGAAKVQGFDAQGPLRWMICLILLPLVLPLLLRPVARMLAAGAEWARNAAIAAPLVTLWLMTAQSGVVRAIVPCAAAILLCTLLRRRELSFTRLDVVLVPVFLTTLLALIDIAPKLSVYELVPVAALFVFTVRFAVTFIPSVLPPALAFLAAPLALILQTGFFARDQRYFGWHVLAIVAISPFPVRLFVKDRRRAMKVLTMVVFPLAMYAYWNAMSTMTAEGKPRANFFEDGHALLPASEYLRGERPYVDILPAHGLIEDGSFDNLVFQTGDVTVGRRAKAREVIGTLMVFALYALAWAVTGSAEAALLSVFLSIMLGVFAPSVRMLPAIATLAFLAGAIRWRRPRWFAYAAFGAVVCGLTSLDFGAYTFATLLIALLRAVILSRPTVRIAMTRPLIRLRHLLPASGAKALEGELVSRPFSPPRGEKVPKADEGSVGRLEDGAAQDDRLRYAFIGLLAAIIPLFLAFAVCGILDDFFRGTFVEVLGVSSAYTIGFFNAPALLAEKRFFPEALIAALDSRAVPYVAWPLLAVFSGVAITRRWPRKFEPFVLVAVWSVLTGISYAERQHVYFGMAFAVLFVAATAQLLRRRSPLALVMIGIAFILASPTIHLAVVGTNRTKRGPPADWVEVRDVPRARGALWPTNDAAAIASVKKYLDLALAPDETFFDFTNSATLYFLFRRDCPIRQYEVAFHQTDEQQIEVIRRIESNPKVRAALMPSTPQGRFSVNGIPNAARAPIVDRWIREHFELDFEEGEIQFWRRK